MKKIMLTVFTVLSLSIMASAQTTHKSRPASTASKSTTTQTAGKETAEVKAKSKPTSTVPQKANNAIRRHHRKHSGHKAKAKTSTK